MIADKDRVGTRETFPPVPTEETVAVSCEDMVGLILSVTLDVLAFLAGGDGGGEGEIEGGEAEPRPVSG